MPPTPTQPRLMAHPDDCSHRQQGAIVMLTSFWNNFHCPLVYLIPQALVQQSYCSEGAFNNVGGKMVAPKSHSSALAP